MKIYIAAAFSIHIILHIFRHLCIIAHYRK